MPKGRIYLSVDLKDEELKKMLMEMVAEDVVTHGEATPSTLVRKLIRNEWYKRHPTNPMYPARTVEEWIEARKGLHDDGLIIGAG